MCIEMILADQKYQYIDKDEKATIRDRITARDPGELPHENRHLQGIISQIEEQFETHLEENFELLAQLAQKIVFFIVLGQIDDASVSPDNPDQLILKL